MFRGNNSFSGVLKLLIIVGATSGAEVKSAEPTPLLFQQNRQGEAVRFSMLATGLMSAPGAIEIVSIDECGPASRLETADPDVLLKLEPGDLITMVNGIPPQSFEHFRALMSHAAITNNGAVPVRVFEKNTGVSFACVVRPVRIKQLPEPARKIPEHRRATGVKAIVVGQTNDADVGSAVDVSVNQWKRLLQLNGDQLPSKGLPELNEVIFLTGANAAPATILSTIRRMQVKPTETLLFIYLGHGAYDVSQASVQDTSRGHYFSLSNTAGYDLMREVVRFELLKKSPRLLVLLSDSCNAQNVAMPCLQDNQIHAGDNWALGNLLLDHRGIVDINGASRDQLGICDNDIGLWFTFALCRVVDPTMYGDMNFITWDAFLARASSATNQVFQSRIRLAVDPQLRSQTSLDPQAFTLDVARTDKSGNKKRIPLPRPAPAAAASVTCIKTAHL